MLCASCIMGQKIILAPNMQAIGFYLALPFLYLLSILPRWLLYGLSDVVFFLLYHVVEYRKKVILENLKNSFPEKNALPIEEVLQRLEVLAPGFIKWAKQFQ